MERSDPVVNQGSAAEVPRQRKWRPRFADRFGAMENRRWLRRAVSIRNAAKGCAPLRRERRGNGYRLWNHDAAEAERCAIALWEKPPAVPVVPMIVHAQPPLGAAFMTRWGEAAPESTLPRAEAARSEGEPQHVE